MCSTYEEDCEEGDDIILCDGCNAEAHLRCLNLTTVPSTEWHCTVCTDRIAVREARGGQGYLSLLKDVESHRDKEQEEELVNRALDQKADEAQGMFLTDHSEDKCTYCGLGELDICSPLVVGQCRSEHEAHLSLCKPTVADYFFPDKVSTTVRFSIHGEIITPPPLGMPYFPLLESANGQRLLEQAAEESEERRQAMIVHQVCALQIFSARMDRERHSLRRRRSLVAKRAISLAGISCRPLGTDLTGREYWRFPTSIDLFVREGDGAGCVGSRDVDKEAFKKLRAYERYEEEEEEEDDDDDESEEDEDNGNGDDMKDDKIKVEIEDDMRIVEKTNHINTSTAVLGKAKSVKRWKIIKDTSQIRKVYDLLGPSQQELELKQNLLHCFLSERKISERENSALLLPDNIDENKDNEEKGIVDVKEEVEKESRNGNNEEDSNRSTIVRRVSE